MSLKYYIILGIIIFTALMISSTLAHTGHHETYAELLSRYHIANTSSFN